MIALKIIQHAGISLAFLLSAASAAAAPPIAGEWLTEGGKASVLIGACGRAMCGRIAKVHKPDPGFPTRDAANADVTKRANPIEGTNILTDLTDGGRSGEAGSTTRQTARHMMPG